MTRYAKTDGSTVLEFKSFDSADGHLTPVEAQAAGKTWWLPYITAPRPPYNSATHHPPAREADAIFADRVEMVWAAPVAKTQEEIDAETTARQDNALADLDQPNSFEKALAIGLFNAVNEIRVLKGDGTITSQQFKDYLRGLM